MTTRKYEFTGDTRTLNCGTVVKQIRRLSDNLVGGWIESEDNLSHEGNCFVYDNAIVHQGAQVYGNAQVYGSAQVYGNAQVFGNAWVYGYAQVVGHVKVCGSALVTGHADIYGNAEVTKCTYVQQPEHGITATDTYVFIGCEGHTWEHWEANIDTIGKANGYTDTEIEDTKALLSILKRQVR